MKKKTGRVKGTKNDPEKIYFRRKPDETLKAVKKAIKKGK